MYIANEDFPDGILIDEYLIILQSKIDAEKDNYTKTKLIDEFNSCNNLLQNYNLENDAYNKVDNLLKFFYEKTNGTRDEDYDLSDEIVEKTNEVENFLTNFKSQVNYSSSGKKYSFIDKFQKYKNIMEDYLIYDFSYGKYQISKEELEIL